jgi:hypothetical protein
MAAPHMGHGSALAYRLQSAKNSAGCWCDAKRMRFVAACPVQSGPRDHRVFSLEQHLFVGARKQGTEGLITSLARPAGERDSGSEV